MPIFRLFSAPEDARAAVADLKQAGYDDGVARILTRATDATNAATLVKARMAPAQADHFAARISQGDTLLIFEAPLGTSARAIEIMRRHGATASETSPDVHEGVHRDPATPFSSAFGFRVLSHDPTPLSSFLKLPVLSRKAGGKRSTLGLPLLSSDVAPLSRLLGIKLLLSDPAPLSRLLKMEVLSKRKTFL